MRTLAIETSGAACSIALFEDRHIIAERHEIVGRGHAERLIPWIAELPNGGRADQIIVGCGPGSFTGLRIGIAAARGLGLGWGVSVFGVSSLFLLAAQFELPLTVAVEGGHGELFVQDFVGPILRAECELQSLTAEVAAAQALCSLVVGSGAERLVAARGSGRAMDGQACAADVLRIEPRYRSHAPSPIYGRGADAKPMA
jgi:tRNA threonylcarbamoyladenosine biosynthesis protein TsaB